MGEPTNGNGVMNQCSIKDVITTDGYRLSLIVSAQKEHKRKSMAQLLEPLVTETPRVRVKSSLAHLLGERAVDLDAVNNEKMWYDICIILHNHLCETLGLTRTLRMHRWNLHLDLVVTNSEGVVIFSGTVLNWTMDKLSEYYIYSVLFKRCLTAQFIINAISSYETGYKD